MTKTFRPALVFACAIFFASALQPQAGTAVLGYTNTPVLAGQPWRVHDPDRPHPRTVTPGESFSHQAPPPSDAEVLFDGKNLDQWKGNKGDATWKVENGYMEVASKAGSIRTRDEFSDFQLHLEFATPAVIDGSSQGRGNSGVLIFGTFEVQVLDSSDNPTYADGQCGAMYGQFPPMVNASKKPGEWQSYDIIFEAPRWDGAGKQTKLANVTVLHNGVLLHHRKEYMGESAHRETPAYKKRVSRGPIELQDHNNPMRFRNIWIRNLGEYDKP
jgi:hypothetical protein